MVADIQCISVDGAVLVGLHDITAQVAVRRELQVAQGRMRAVLDSDIDPRLVVQALRDDDGEIHDFVIDMVNPAAAAAIRAPEAAVIGRRITEFMTEDGARELVPRYRAVVETGEPLVVDALERFQVNEIVGRFVDIRAAKTDDGLSIVWRDVTNSVLAEQRLQQSEEHYRLLVENTSDVVLMMRDVQWIEWVSPSCARTLGWSPEQLEGTSIIEYFHPDELAELSEIVAGVGADTGEIRAVTRFRCGDGVYRWMEAVGTPVARSGSHLATTVRVRDVDAEHRATEALAASEERFRLLAENSTDVVMLVNDDTVTWVSPALSSTLGYAQEAWIGHALTDFVSAQDQARVLELASDLAQGRSLVTRLRLVDHTGSEHWVELHAGPNMKDGAVRDGAVASFRIVDAEVEMERQREHLARFDTLTGLMNRGEVLRAVAGIREQLPRTGTKTALLFCDVDEFKAINDRYGHAVGDVVLRALAERLRECIRADDYAARIGGDEFLVVLGGLHGVDEAVAVAEKIRHLAVEAIEVPGASVVSTSMSIGVTLIDPAHPVDLTIERADAAMYQAKAAGRNHVSVIV